MLNSPFTEAASTLLGHEGARLPDWSNLVVLVPHYAAGQGLLAGLGQVLGRQAILPPRLLTLPEYAATVSGRPSAEPDSRRVAGIYNFLKRLDRLPERQLWPAAAELAGLLREMSDSQLLLPQDFEQFRLRLEAAYRRKLGGAMSFEASLAHELWYAMQHTEQPDSGRDYAERLAWLAGHAKEPLYHLELPGLNAVERAFLARYAERQPVRALPLVAPYPERAEVLAAAWAAEPGDAATTNVESPLRGSVVILPANSLEAEARTAEAQIRQWLAEGVDRIGIVALDRVSARRLRALLERQGILVQDETGWTFSTAAVSHVLDRWFALVQDDCYYRDLLDLLKSPYVFADQPAAELQSAVAALELALRRQGVVEGWSRFQRLAREIDAPLAAVLLERLQAARALFAVKRLPLAGWQQRLLHIFDMLAIAPALEADWAGTQFISLLRRLEREVAGEAASYRFAEWRRWLMLQIDQATFVDARVESPVRFTHLRAARLREFGTVLILGADAAHLPESGRAGLFNQAARAELGLQGQAEREGELKAALADVAGRADRLCITWQSLRAGEPVALSPWLETLDLYHRRRFGCSLKGATQGFAENADIDGLPAPAGRPAPSSALLPERMTVSGWQSLVDCPYRFYARHLLGLNELDEVMEEMGKREYGTLIHAVLAKFHEDNPILADKGRAEIEAELASAVNAAFVEAGLNQFLAEAWRLRWQRRQAAYLDWVLDWERDGNRFAKAEAKVSLAVSVGAAEVRLEGRLDRLDAGPQGLAVLDYKTQSRAGLLAKLRQPGEDVQLPCYGWLAEAAEAGFVVLDEDKTSWLPWKDDLAGAAEAEAARFREVVAGLAAGTPLPAQGAQKVCIHCELRGLCRRDHWADT